MPRELSLVTRAASRLEGTTRIEPGHPRDCTPEQMRMWADDMARLNRTSPDEHARLRAGSPADLTREQQRMLAVQDRLLLDASVGIKGSLRDDGKIELDGGCHRAGYMVERGVDPIPVWVPAPEQRQLDDLRAECDRSRGRDRGRDEQGGSDRVRT